MSRFALSVRAVIRDSEGRILVLRRSKNCTRFVGKWELPGGKLEPGEAFDTALLREVAEETNLQIQLRQALMVSQGPVGELMVVYLIMDTNLISGDVVISEEHDAERWVHTSEAQNLDIMPEFRSVFETNVGS